MIPLWQIKQMWVWMCPRRALGNIKDGDDKCDPCIGFFQPLIDQSKQSMLISLQNTQGTGGLHTLNGHRVNTDYQITVKGVREKEQREDSTVRSMISTNSFAFSCWSNQHFDCTLKKSLYATFLIYNNIWLETYLIAIKVKLLNYVLYQGEVCVLSLVAGSFYS